MPDPVVTEPQFQWTVGGVAAAIIGLIGAMYRRLRSDHSELKADLETDMKAHTERKDADHKELWSAIDKDRERLNHLEATTASRTDLGKLFDHMNGRFDRIEAKIDGRK